MGTKIISTFIFQTIGDLLVACILARHLSKQSRRDYERPDTSETQWYVVMKHKFHNVCFFCFHTQLYDTISCRNQCPRLQNTWDPSNVHQVLQDSTLQTRK